MRRKIITAATVPLAAIVLVLGLASCSTLTDPDLASAALQNATVQVTEDTVVRGLPVTEVW